jgi:hypothetical protein
MLDAGYDKKVSGVRFQLSRWQKTSGLIEKNSEKADPPEADKYRIMNPNVAKFLYCRVGIAHQK